MIQNPQTCFKVAPLHRRLHALALASLTVTLAFLILLSVSKITSSSQPALELGRAEFNGAAPTKLVDGKSGETVAENLRYINYGLWNYCWGTQQAPSNVSCSNSGLGYSHTIIRTDAFPVALTVPAVWTRALILHPIAAVTAFFALLPMLLMRTAFKGYSVVLSTVSLAMVLATLAVDIAFGVVTGGGLRVNAGLNGFFFFDIGFWLMIVPTLFGIVAWVATIIGHLKKRDVKVVYYAEPDFPMSSANTQANFDNGPWWKRFKWAGANTANTSHSQTTTVVGTEQPTMRSV